MSETNGLEIHKSEKFTVDYRGTAHDFDTEAEAKAFIYGTECAANLPPRWKVKEMIDGMPIWEEPPEQPKQEHCKWPDMGGKKLENIAAEDGPYATAADLAEIGLPNSFEMDEHGDVIAAGVSNGSDTEQQDTDTTQGTV